MTLLTEIYNVTSANKQEGMAIVAPEGTKLPAQGSIESIGIVHGIDTFLFTPGTDQTWVDTLNEVFPISGCTVIMMKSLQATGTRSIVLLSREAYLKEFGPGRKTSETLVYKDGIKETKPIKDVPLTVLAAKGIIEAGEGTVDIETPVNLDAGKITDLKALL